MRSNEQSQKEWVLLDEAAKCSIYSKRQIQKLAEKGIQRIRTKKTLDFKPTDKYNYYMYVTKEGFNHYKTHNNVPLTYIIMECAELKKVNP